ncbi:MAG: RNA polymerase sigma-70 factor [Cytophagaceae bacterium]|nr:MAG: RNA polymerase sigma-70 factor [Cytophagaceae bacterium]
MAARSWLSPLFPFPTPIYLLPVKVTKSALANPLPTAAADAELFKQLFAQHASGIYRLAYAQLHSRAEAQEVVQECFLKYWEKRQAVSPEPDAIKGYLYTSAYHTILNQVRRQRSWVCQDYPEDLAAEQEPPAAMLEYQELTTMYTNALAQLPTKRQQIFVMSRQDGLSNALIGRELGISVKTVEAQITHALKFLRTYFVAHGTVLLLLAQLLAP